MKIRTDFVTNSSSTSFVVITSDGFDEPSFLKLMGVKKRSPFAPLFEALFYHIKNSMNPLDEYINKQRSGEDSWQELIQEEFSQEVVERIVDAKNKGKKIYIGKLDSDGDLIESYFCTDSFEVENKDIYFNALKCIW